MKRLCWLFLFLAAMAIAGCKTSPERTAYNASATVVTSVDQAMTGWGHYVVGERARVKAITNPVDRLAQAKILAAKEVKVRTAYDAYLETAIAGIATAAASSGGEVPQLPAGDVQLIALIISQQF